MFFVLIFMLSKSVLAEEWASQKKHNGRDPLHLLYFLSQSKPIFVSRTQWCCFCQ